MSPEPSVPEVVLTDAQRTALICSLRSACGGDTDAVAVDEEALNAASKDWSFHTPHRPCAVVSPASTEEVAAIVRVCASAKVPMIPRGAGTGVEGGAIPYGGGVVIATERLRKLEVREDEMLATVGAGIYKDELNKFLLPKGLIFGPDPSSNPTLGGMASTGGSGMTTLRYGTTQENVARLVVVTPHGEIVETRRAVRKSSSGYELTQLYMGAEGTLGIICELTVRLQRQQPLRSGGVLPFSKVEDAVRTVVAALREDPPSLLRCELLNAEGVEATNKVFKTKLEECPLLFLEFRGKDLSALKSDFDSVVKLASGLACAKEDIQFATNGEDLDELWDARRGCYIAGMKYRGFKGGDRVHVGDVCVPIPRLAECVAAAEADARALGLKCIICAHIADGNFHTLIPYQPTEFTSMRKFETSLVNRAIDCGGTVSGEHGIGVGKIQHSCKEHGEVHVSIQQKIKHALDPDGLMNPGKVLPLPTAPASSKL